MQAHDVYEQSDASVTRRYYASLEACGPLGKLAAALMRTHKASFRAKLYRGKHFSTGARYRDLAYRNKQEALHILVRTLEYSTGIVYGWGRDGMACAYVHVLYIDLPGQGQVSFHSPTRGNGPDYPGVWDGQHASQPRILAFCDAVLANLLQGMQQERLFA